MSRFFTLEQAESFAPLVRSVLRSLATACARMAELLSRDELLHECRHAVDYRARLQFYRHVEEKSKLESEIANLEEELNEAGAEIVERTPLSVGVPFHYKSKKNDGRRRKKAFFMIDAAQGNGTIQNFRIAGEHSNRAIPTHWRHARKPSPRRVAI